MNKWETVNNMLGECEDKTINNLLSIVTAGIEWNLEDEEISDHDKAILKKVYDFLYKGVL